MPKKTYHIVKATTRNMQPTLDGEAFPLPPNGSVTTTDSGIANEIEQVYGKKGTGEMMVASQPYTGGESGHKYFFGGKHTKEWNEFWERYERKKLIETRKRGRKPEATNDLLDRCRSASGD